LRTPFLSSYVYCGCCFCLYVLVALWWRLPAGSWWRASLNIAEHAHNSQCNLEFPFTIHHHPPSQDEKRRRRRRQADKDHSIIDWLLHCCSFAQGGRRQDIIKARPTVAFTFTGHPIIFSIVHRPP
jgi:hypothetical protein